MHDKENEFVGEDGPELVMLPEDVEVTCSGGIILPPIANRSEPDAADDTSD